MLPKFNNNIDDHTIKSNVAQLVGDKANAKLYNG